MDRAKLIEEAAATWLARRDGENWDAEDEAALRVWLEHSTAHRVAFLRLNAAWQQADRLKALAAGLPAGQVPLPGRWQSPAFLDGRPTEDATRVGTNAREIVRRKGLILATAASLFTAVIGVSLFLWPYGGSDFRTVVGGIAAVPMLDGSTVTLNTDSEISVTVTATERRVELHQGEAYFEVARDPSRPFVVSAGNRRVIALGTKFAVWRTHDNLRVVVREGSVRVEVEDGALPAIAVLAAGAVARTSSEGTLVQEQPLQEIEEYLSWRSGYLVFHETTLGEAADEFNRYNHRKLVIVDPNVAAIRIGGSFRAANVDAFVRLLEQGLPVRAIHQEGRVFLTAG